MNQLEKTGLITIAVGALAFCIGVFDPALDIIPYSHSWETKEIALLILGGALIIIGLGIYVFGLSKNRESS
jgi:hypothetical protein